jgi:spore maturation protein B
MNIMTLLNPLSNGLFLSFVVGIPCYAACKKINAFDSFVTGAKEGFQTVIRILPYLVAILVAIGMLRASGFFELLNSTLSPVLSRWGVPSDILPLALIRPFSGSASNGIMAELIQHHGGDSYISHLAATIMGSTETTFYVVAIYMGSIAIKRTRYAIPAGLIADAVGIIASIIVCSYLFAK